MEGFVFDVDVCRRTFDYFDTVVIIARKLSFALFARSEWWEGPVFYTVTSTTSFFKFRSNISFKWLPCSVMHV